MPTDLLYFIRRKRGMAKRKKGTVGVVGLGIMGGAFAKNLAARGWHVIGYDPAPAATRAARRTGVEMSTFMIEDKEKAERALRKAGHVMIDAPVSGTGSQAKTRDLVFYASGDRRAIKRLNRMFADF